MTGQTPITLVDAEGGVAAAPEAMRHKRRSSFFDWPSILLLVALYGPFLLGPCLAFSQLTVGASLILSSALLALAMGLHLGFSTLMIERVTRVKPLSIDSLPESTQQVLTSVCAKHGLPLPRLGLIEQDEPNAFTFGRSSRPCVAVTRGLLAFDPANLNAVLAHEIGHVYHRDFTLVTVAAFPAVLLLFIYSLVRRASGVASSYKTMWQLLSESVRLVHVLAQLLFLALSRVREHRADAFAAQIPGTAQHLADALQEIAAWRPTSEAERRTPAAVFASPPRQIAVVRMLGIAELQPAPVNVHVPSRGLPWQLLNPWALIYEARSTHPAISRRVAQLRRIAAAEEDPLSVSDAAVRWRYLASDLPMWLLPAVAVALWTASTHDHLPLFWLGSALAAMRICLSRRGRRCLRTLGDVLDDARPSPARAIAVSVEATVSRVERQGFRRTLVLQDGADTLPARISALSPIVGHRSATWLHRRIRVEGWVWRRPDVVLEPFRLIDVGTEQCLVSYSYSIKLLLIAWVTIGRSIIMLLTT